MINEGKKIMPDGSIDHIILHRTNPKGPRPQQRQKRRVTRDAPNTIKMGVPMGKNFKHDCTSKEVAEIVPITNCTPRTTTNLTSKAL